MVYVEGAESEEPDPSEEGEPSWVLAKACEAYSCIPLDAVWNYNIREASVVVYGGVVNAAKEKGGEEKDESDGG